MAGFERNYLHTLSVTTYRAEGHLDIGMTKSQELTAPAMQNEIPPLSCS